MRPLDGTWFDEIAQVYRACAVAGLADPRAVDELELWEIGALIGANDALEDANVAESTQDWNVRRILALEAGMDEPEFESAPMSASDHAQVRTLIGEPAAHV